MAKVARSRRGRFSCLLRPHMWQTMQEAGRDIARAGRTSAAIAPSGRHTPFDNMAHHLSLETRRGQQDPQKRRFAQRALMEVRRHQKLWRATQKVKTATLQGRNLVASARPKHTVVLSGTSTFPMDLSMMCDVSRKLRPRRISSDLRS